MVPEIKQALDILEESAFTPAELEYYDKYWDNIRIEATLMKDAKEEGELIGEKRKAFEAAKVLLLQGVSKEIIMLATGLSADELDTL